MSIPMIKTEKLSHTYEDENGDLVYAVKDVSLTVEEGEFVAVIGTNGSGKSTLAKHFNALLLPTSGVCEIDGMRTDNADLIWDIRRRVGMVFQNPDNQIVAAVVEEDAAFGPENLGVPSAEIRERVDKALATVGMTAFVKHAPHLLSGGQKQRIAIAGILAMHSTCIILDEPTAMLDPTGRAEVMETLLKLHKQGITIVLIIERQGEPHEIFSHVPELLNAGLDVPVAAEIAAGLRKKGLDLPQQIITEKELGDALCL